MPPPSLHRGGPDFRGSATVTTLTYPTEVEKSPDALDEVQHASERELAIRNLDRESNLLRNVRAALRRIDEGSFGVCLHCEEDISPRRLAAVPWTAFCIQCQEMADRQIAEGVESLDELLVNAA